MILIPVELGRSDARDRFHLKYTGGELGENVSLAEKLKQGFGIRKFPELPDPDDLDVGTYFKNVQRAVSGQSGWSVDTDAIALGFFFDQPDRLSTVYRLLGPGYLRLRRE